MKKQIILTIIMMITFGVMISIHGQNTFTFTGIKDAAYFRPDSIKVKNLTQDCDTLLYYPDTVLIIYNVGIKEDVNPRAGFRVMQNFPNPVSERTNIRMNIPHKDQVSVVVTDAIGRRIISSDMVLEKGLHSFLFTPPGEGLYFFNAYWKGYNSSVRILAIGTGSQHASALEYAEGTPSPAEIPLKSATAAQNFLFSPGDELMLIGYADTLESGFLDSPETDQDYVFQFAANIPCPGLDSLYYDGQWYRTIQVFSQCWLKENMNAGTMIFSGQDQTNNDLVEKYCMGDMESYCDLFGGLYFWDEMMKYTSETGGQGICPDGFHVPTDLEWQILEGAADSEYMIGAPEWKVNGWRGTDAGGNLKQAGTELWEYPNTGATDVFGFSVIPAGYFVQGDFWGPGYKSYIWSSNNVWMYLRNFDWNQAKIQRNTGGSEAAISVRCIKN